MRFNTRPRWVLPVVAAALVAAGVSTPALASVGTVRSPVVMSGVAKTQPSVPMLKVQATKVCTFVVSGNPGIKTFKLKVIANGCGITIRAEMLCIQPHADVHTAFWVSGTKVHKSPRPHHPYISFATCGKIIPPIHIDPFGLEWTATGKAPWHWVALGPNPPNTSPAAPQGRCSPEANGKPGIISFTIHFRHDRCKLGLRAEVLCWYVPPNQHAWHNGFSVFVGDSRSYVNCKIPQFFSMIDPAGYEWKGANARKWPFFTETWPKPPAGK